MGAAADHHAVAVGGVGEVLAVEDRVAGVEAHRLLRREGLLALGLATDVRSVLLLNRHCSGLSRKDGRILDNDLLLLFGPIPCCCCC